ncbi:hypothetical protein DdX_02936 [Ditylenchus destructor]|uniref:Uncharacterized protein n=1 Tax=Ditylenchus destructor TaxID=166010 RepID=A0AAD4NDQ3_9BILA|nr:hypothetical protein DdX_02936 [Ditylenchus destructor]
MTKSRQSHNAFSGEFGRISEIETGPQTCDDKTNPNPNQTPYAATRHKAKRREECTLSVASSLCVCGDSDAHTQTRLMAAHS